MGTGGNDANRRRFLSLSATPPPPKAKEADDDGDDDRGTGMTSFWKLPYLAIAPFLFDRESTSAIMPTSDDRAVA
jgi:hypothetical protein